MMLILTIISNTCAILIRYQLDKGEFFPIKDDRQAISDSIEIALFVLDGKSFYTLSNVCAHKGGPLNEGVIEGDVVACPWHGSA